jgi:hypothetical protein
VWLLVWEKRKEGGKLSTYFNNAPLAETMAAGHDAGGLFQIQWVVANWAELTIVGRGRSFGGEWIGTRCRGGGCVSWGGDRSVFRKDGHGDSGYN